MKCFCCDNTGTSRAVFSWVNPGTGKRIRLFRCKRCGLLFQSPLPSKEELQKLYGEEFFQAYEKHFLDYRKKQFSQDMKTINRLSAVKKGKLLDVGCAFGLFLEEAEKNGWDASGIDVSEEALRRARKNGCKVSRTTLEEAHLPDAGFDVLSAWDVIEHLSDPALFLKECSRVLKQNGILALRTPNANGMMLMVVRPVNRILGERFAKTGPRFMHHLFLFSEKALRRLLEKNGFRLLRVEMDNENLIIVEDPTLLNKAKAAAKKCIKAAELALPWLRESMVIYAQKI